MDLCDDNRAEYSSSTLHSGDEGRSEGQVYVVVDDNGGNDDGLAAKRGPDGHPVQKKQRGEEGEAIAILLYPKTLGRSGEEGRSPPLNGEEEKKVREIFKNRKEKI